MTIEHKFSNTGPASIQELLQSNSKFLVPKFQRNYSWNNEKVEALWEDLMDNFNQIKHNPEKIPDAQYLLGPVVLVRSEKQGEFFIIDGQQRLSTITTMFCVARDIIRENVQTEQNTSPEGLEKITEMIENKSMQRKGWKLELNDTDKDLFEQIQEYENQPLPQIERIKSLNVQTKSEKLLRDSYILLHKKIMESLHTGFSDEREHKTNKKTPEEDQKAVVDNISMLNYFLAHVRENNFVVKIVVDKPDTAYQIFETLNERGQTLSKSNLIKNYILSKIENKSDQSRHSQKWNDIFDYMKQPDDEFIIESLRSRHFDIQATISKKNLYKIIQSKFKDESSCKRYIRELEEDASFLQTLNDPTSYRDEHTKNEVYAIKALSAKFIRTPMLAAYREWQPKYYQKIVKLLVKFFFKFRVVRMERTGLVEKIVMKTTRMIMKEKKSYNEVAKYILEYDDHDDFLYNFKRKLMVSPPTDVAKYILYEITCHLRPPSDDVRPIDSLTLEHILPKNYKYWEEKEFFAGYENPDDKGMGEFVDQLGNLTLLKQAVNSKSQDHVFSDKKQEYKLSGLEINKQTVCNQDEWTAQIIKQREEKFAEYANEIWKLK